MASGAAGWLRSTLLPALADVVSRTPWEPARRALVGLCYEVPAGLAVVALLALAARFVALRPWRAAVTLTAAVAGLDLAAALLVAHDLGLWNDGVVAVARLLVAATTATAGALAVGWRPRRPPGRESEPTVEAERDGV